MHAHVLKFMSMFGTMYACEQMFSIMNLNKSKSRMSSDSAIETVLQISTAKSIVPNIGKLVAAKPCQKST